MSTGRPSIMDALSHASILTCFRKSQPPPQSYRRQPQRLPPPPPYRESYRHSPLLPRILEAECEDDTNEEPRYGGWGEDPEPLFRYDDEDSGDERDVGKCCWGFYETISLICYLLLILLLVLNLDAILSRMAIGSMKGAAEEMHFCLNETSRTAPVSRVWRFIPSLSHEDCATEIATMTAEPTDAWKLNSDDKIIFEDAGANGRIFIQKRSERGFEADHLKIPARGRKGKLRQSIRDRRQN